MSRIRLDSNKKANKFLFLFILILICHKQFRIFCDKCACLVEIRKMMIVGNFKNSIVVKIFIISF